MAKTLYISDMDGTLLGADSKLSENSARIITDLTRRGANITVATARTPATVEIILTNALTSLPAIVMTGAAMWQRDTKTYCNVCYLSDDTYCQLMKRCHEYGINPFRYTLNDGESMQVYHNGVMTAAEQEFVEGRLNLGLKNFNLDTPYGLQSTLPGIVFFFAMGDREKIFALADDLRSSVNCSVSCYVDIFDKNTGFIELFAPGVSKAAAVKQLAKDVEATRIVVFGDNLNDIPMMQVADVAVAVENALPEVKAIAHNIIGANTTDAVPLFIEQDFMKTDF